MRPFGKDEFVKVVCLYTCTANEGKRERMDGSKVLLSSQPNQVPTARISIALATYNGKEHLSEQLTSLAEQTLLPCELVVTDDGSTDNTLNIVRAFAKTAPFPVHVHANTERLGYGGNFLRAASLCRGDLIAFCDQDDRWLAPKLATCAKYFDDSDTTLVIHSSETWDGHTRLGRLFPSYQETQITSPGTTDPFALTPGFSVVFRRGLLNLTKNEDRPGCLFGLSNGSIMAHDAWIWLLGTTTGKVAMLSDVLALYRQHGSNTVGAPGKRSLRRKLQLATDTVDYETLAEFERKCAEVLGSIPDSAAPGYIPERKTLIDQLLHRSELHRSRARVYSRTANFADRAGSFLSMLSSGAYSPAQSKNRIGPRAAVKDLSYGVSGLYKRLTESTQ